MSRSRGIAFAIAVVAAVACAPQTLATPSGSALPASIASEQLPRTRAERSDFTETSRYADVVAFIDSLQKLRAPIAVGSIGKTSQGRDIPYVIASRPLVRTPAAARRLGRPVVYVQGNIHAGEVEGKEALQALLRDLVFEPKRNVLDSIVLIAVPIYNADGNEAVGPQERNRSSQNGPQIVGGRASAQELNLNRDYVKAEAPETRASLAMFNEWNPDVFVDLHTTNGSYHGYALTYSPPLTPAAPLAGYTQTVWLPLLRERMRTRHRFETFDYGNFLTDERELAAPTSAAEGWATYDHRPRYSTNYYGMRNGVAILSEAYSHDPFARRVAATDAFVREILSLAAERGAEIKRLRAAASGQGAGQVVPIRSQLTRAPSVVDVIVEDVVATGDSARTEPGVPRGRRRTGNFRTVKMPVYDRFDPTLTVNVRRGYVVTGGQPRVIDLLAAHGISVERMDASRVLSLERFTVDSVIRAARPFEGHNEERVTGRWSAATESVSAGSYFIPTEQPLGRLVVYLLEPESDDGLLTWNYFPGLARGSILPVARVAPGPSAPNTQ
ncbi:MAG TPA: M14 family metallopeptidase [Gemmatimonadaceae bacterium]|nr:M14 family metallopeptidase [Gemmatimonadaceae bacterium]